MAADYSVDPGMGPDEGFDLTKLSAGRPEALSDPDRFREVPMYVSGLNHAPELIDPALFKLGFEIRYDGQEAPARRLYAKGIGEHFELIMALDRAWDIAGKYLLQHDCGYVNAFLPEPESEILKPRIHLALPLGLEGSFDRIMDHFRLCMLFLWDGAYTDNTGPLEIMLEPFGEGGLINDKQVDFMTFAVGSTWLQHGEEKFFPDYLKWSSASASFIQE